MEGGPPRFPRDSSCPAVLGIVANAAGAVRLRGSHPLWPAFPDRSAQPPASASGCSSSPHDVPQPQVRNGCRLGTDPVWAQAPVAHHYWGPRCCFLFLGVLRCFSSPGSPRAPMDSVRDDPASPGPGCPIRTPAAQRPSTAPRGFSQSPASFFGPRRPGIPRAPHPARRPPAGAPSPRDRTPQARPRSSSPHHSPLVKAPATRATKNPPRMRSGTSSHPAASPTGLKRVDAVGGAYERESSDLPFTRLQHYTAASLT